MHQPFLSHSPPTSCSTWALPALRTQHTSRDHTGPSKVKLQQVDTTAIWNRVVHQKEKGQRETVDHSGTGRPVVWHPSPSSPVRLSLSLKTMTTPTFGLSEIQLWGGDGSEGWGRVHGYILVTNPSRISDCQLAGSSFQGPGFTVRNVHPL